MGVAVDEAAAQGPRYVVILDTVHDRDLGRGAAVEEGHRVGLGGVTVSEWGLREGVILEAAEQAQGVLSPVVRLPVLREPAVAF